MDISKTEAILEHIEKNSYESFRIKEDILSHIETPLHYHPHYEFVWIKAGVGVRIVGDHVSPFKENDMMLIGPNLPHVWTNAPEYYAEDPDLMVDVYVVHFAEEILNELICKFPELMNIKQLLFNSRRGMQIVGETNIKLREIIFKLKQATSIERFVLFMQIFHQLENTEDTQLLSSEKFASLFCESESERLRKIYEHISKNFHRNIQLEEVSNIACLSPTAFCRYFKQKTGLRFTSFLNDFRLEYAQNLMNNNAYKISTIAHMCGFQDISYFNKMFKEKNAITPSEYIMRLKHD